MKSNISLKYRGCEFADDLLSPNIKSWLVKFNFKNTLKVPFRTNGMTSSGYKYKCHQNVLNLVNAYGGKRLGGYAVCIDHDDDAGADTVQFLSHSVWVTPEGIAVDVTPSNKYSFDPLYQHFLPVVEESSFETIFISFLLIEDLVDKVILVNDRRSNDVYDYSRVSASYFTKSMLIKKQVMSRGDLVESLHIGGFSEASSTTGHNWKSIYDSRIAPKFI